MKTRIASPSLLVTLVCFAFGTLSHGQQVITGNADYAFGASDVFTWTLNGNTTTQSGTNPSVYDQRIANNSSPSLTIASGADFQIAFGQSVDLSNSFWNTNQTWTVFENFNPGQSNGAFDVVAPASLATFRPGAFFTVTPVTNKNVTLTYNAAAFVPEPSTALAGVLLACGLLRRRRAA